MKRISQLYTLFLSTFAVLITATVFAGTLLVLKTPAGDIEIELFDEDKPVTVSNFIHYVESGYFDGAFIDRWETNFVIQGGTFLVVTNGGGSSIDYVQRFPAITNEYSVGRELRNLYGTISMARAGGQTNSATSAWFINLKDNSFLDGIDGGFTVFGQVVRGTNVLEIFQSFEAAESNEVGYLYRPWNGSYNYVPVASTNQTVTASDLFFTDFELLKAQVTAQVDGSVDIRWNSVSNLPNRVEYSETFATNSWMELVVTNGTGESMTVTDSSASGFRSYRIQVDYP